MPLFRRIHRNPDDDSTYAFDRNPDPEQFEDVDAPAQPKPEAEEPAAEPEPVQE